MESIYLEAILQTSKITIRRLCKIKLVNVLKEVEQNF